MSYPEREHIETEEDATPNLRLVVKQNGAPKGVARNGRPGLARLQRLELVALGWEARRKRLSVKS
jgi:hypothetical protein